MGESPTLPGRLAVIPPVEVAKAVLPALSRATAPTVSQPLFISLNHTSVQIHLHSHEKYNL